MDVGDDHFHSQKHFHGAYYEILFVYSGEGNIIVRDKAFPIKPSGIYFINGRLTHCSVPNAKQEYKRAKLVIDQGFIDGVASATDCASVVNELFKCSDGVCILLEAADAAAVEREFVKLNDAIGAPDLYTKSKVAHGVMSILCRAHSSLAGRIESENTRLSGVLGYIDDNIANRITLEDICKKEYLSKYYLCHTFKRRMGVSIFEYILSRRLDLAKQLLAGSDMPVSEISERCGFSGFSYFSKIFRETEGVTPRQYRLDNKGEA